MTVSKTFFLLTSISIGFVAFTFSGHFIQKTLINLLFSLFAIVLGSSLGVVVFVLFLNFLERKKFYLAQNSNFETFLRRFNVALQDEDGESDVDGSKTLIEKAKVWRRRFYNSLQIFSLKVVYRLINAPMVKDQIGNSSVTDTNAVRNPSVYELIRPYGQTPDGMLASAYGPTAVGHSTNAICVSKQIDKIMHKIFEYTYRDYVEIW